MWKQLKLSTKVIVIVVSTVILILASLSFFNYTKIYKYPVSTD